MVFSETSESFHDFAQALVDLGVRNAIYLVGSGYSYGFRYDEQGNQTYSELNAAGSLTVTVQAVEETVYEYR